MELTREYFDQKLDENLSPIKADINDLKIRVNSIAIDVTDIKATVDRIDTRDLEDSNAFASTVVGFDNRIARIERKLKIPAPKFT